MSTLYKPVKITSAEQAEALPVGTLARHSKGAGMDHAHKVEALGFQVWIGDRANYYNASMVGWTALVPIEAEEECAVRLGAEGGMILPVSTRDPAPGHGGVDNLPRLTRLVTPWEEA